MSHSTPRRELSGNIVIIVFFAVVFAYPVWSAIGNLLVLPDFYAVQLGVSSDRVPWALLWAGVIVPVLVFVLGVLLGWRRGPGAVALFLTTGFALVSAIGLDIFALYSETRLQLVVDLLTNG